MGLGISGMSMDNIMVLKHMAETGKAAESASQKAAGSQDDEQLKKACSEFEQIFLRMMYKCMKDTVPKSNLVSGGLAGDIFESMLDEKLMEEASQTGSFGLADVLYRQLRE